MSTKSKGLDKPNFIEFEFMRLSIKEQYQKATDFYKTLSRRRTVREFSSDPVPLEIIETVIATAGTAPSSVNLQPWRFVVVQDPQIKKNIRKAAETEEYLNYHGRLPEPWLKRMLQLGTNEQKPFLEIAPYIIVVFRIEYLIDEITHQTKPTYYSQESVGIAVGILLAALHNAGLAALTYTPNPMKFLNRILRRPKNEKPFILIPVGYPVQDVKAPSIKRKQLSEIMQVV